MFILGYDDRLTLIYSFFFLNSGLEIIFFMFCCSIGYNFLIYLPTGHYSLSFSKNIENHYVLNYINIVVTVSFVLLFSHLKDSF